jgi:hypothetical protein
MPVTGRVTSSHGYTDEACESSGSPAIMEHDVLLFRPVTLRPGFSVQFALVQKISTCDAHLIYNENFITFIPISAKWSGTLGISNER